jgi:hypothetical protein
MADPPDRDLAKSYRRHLIVPVGDTPRERLRTGDLAELLDPSTNMFEVLGASPDAARTNSSG